MRGTFYYIKYDREVVDAFFYKLQISAAMTTIESHKTIEEELRLARERVEKLETEKQRIEQTPEFMAARIKELEATVADLTEKLAESEKSVEKLSQLSPGEIIEAFSKLHTETDVHRLFAIHSIARMIEMCNDRMARCYGPRCY